MNLFKSFVLIKNYCLIAIYGYYKGASSHENSNYGDIVYLNERGSMNGKGLNLNRGKPYYKLGLKID